MKFVCAIPTYNEEKYIRNTTEILHSFFTTHFPQHHFTLVIADNGSTDNTKRVGMVLSEELSGVTSIALKEPNKGLAIQEAWKTQDADEYLFVDADLPYGTKTLGNVAKLLEEGKDVVVVSRMAHGASPYHSFVRNISTRIYNIFLHVLFQHNFSDAQAGCKGFSKKAYKEVIVGKAKNGWFFDTCVLLTAEKNGYTVYEIPTTNTDPRPRPPNPNIVRDLFFGALKLRFDWWFKK